MESKKLGPYQLGEELGRGGMGVVYKAMDTTLQRYVAVKVLPAELASEPLIVARFVREARSLAKLHHPNLMNIYTVGEEDGQHYFAMELVEGETLAAVLREKGAFSVQKTVDIMIQVLAGLERVHGAGLVHRDIKPSNIMLDTAGRAILMDFGLAKARTDQVLTAPGSIMGTPEYMPPEQVHGEEADARSDLYSIGVVLFQMVTGWPPFTDKSDINILKKHMDEKPPRLTEVAVDVPFTFDAIVQRLMSKRPEDRFQSASDLAQELVRFRDSTGRTATMPPAGVRGGGKPPAISGLAAPPSLKPAVSKPAAAATPSDRPDLSQAPTILSQREDLISTAPARVKGDAPHPHPPAHAPQSQHAPPATPQATTPSYKSVAAYFVGGMVMCLILLALLFLVFRHFRGGRRKSPPGPFPVILLSSPDAGQCLGPPGREG
ncbi:MAG: serine/threonine protein kinase [Planctomycetes bacterium]|nr:serine/threonine protein kinase [Planctomycetota bacterium]